MKIKKFDYSPILGWSVSRYEKFKLCRRMYYYDYYGKNDSEYELERIKRLKNLTSIPLAVGVIVHDMIVDILNRLLKSDEDIDMERFWAYLERETSKYFMKFEFSEVYYDEIEKIDRKAIMENLRGNLLNFLSSERFRWLKEKTVPDEGKWIIEPEGYGECRLDGLKAYCKVDFLFPVENMIYIIDWKTGKESRDKHRKQLLGYVTWAIYHFDKNPEEVVPIVAYLHPDYREKKMKFTRRDIEGFLIRVKRETEELYSYCRDFYENIPDDKSRFKKTRRKKICSFCNYRELCGR